ncbi:MAG: right-handed parallel beta-helix repeat-containing protein [Planctomycetaceae bacterium]
MKRQVTFIAILTTISQTTFAATWRVPQDQPTITAAIQAADVGDTILVAAGQYSEHIRLKPGIIVRSDGDDGSGTDGLLRAERTVIDGAAFTESVPGVVMAEDSILDGFTVTNVGTWDEAEWTRHFNSHGEELGDDEGAVHAEGTRPAISISGVRCTVRNCRVHHNGDVGIAVIGRKDSKAEALITGNTVVRNMGGGIGVAEGAEPVIRANTCRENLRAGIGCRAAAPIISGNTCVGNVRAGIGCREGATPVIVHNTCRENRRAGIGIRMKDTAPVVADNLCEDNEMAGIGCRDSASPILRNNICRSNKMAGIGCDGAMPLIVENLCERNQLAGIGIQGQAVAIIQKNRCIENRLVAIGVTDGSSATILENELARTGGMPPLIAVKDQSRASIQGNRISGGGVAAVLIQGSATLSHNTLTGTGDRQGNAIWVQENSTAAIASNSFDGYRSAVNSVKASVTITENTVRRFQGTAIIVRNSLSPANVFGNVVISADPQASAVKVEGASGSVDNNIVQPEEAQP